MRSYRDVDFDRALTSLPADAQAQAKAAYRLFRLDPFHPGLQFKQVGISSGIWSARVGIGYRALGRRHRDSILWFWIGTHAEYDQLLGRR